ncbi:MAG: DNA translocase FtsK [Clostridia bacterium]|nr:DNA translocase FtsK [Clostridia bacterium]
MAGKRTVRSSKGKRTAQRKRSAAPSKETFELRRGIWAAINLFMAFVACLSVFEVKGFLITGYDWLARTLFGFGANIFPLVFMSAGLILIIKRKGKARLKVGSLFALPIVVGALHQITAQTGSWSISGLAKSGRELTSGGVIAGFSGQLFNAALSRVGALILFYLLLFVCLFLAFGEFVFAGVEYLKGLNWKITPEPEEEERAPASHVSERVSRRDRQAERARAAAEAEEKRRLEREKNNEGNPFKGIFDIETEEKQTTEETVEETPAVFDPTAPLKPKFKTSDASLEAPPQTAAGEEEKAPETPEEKKQNEEDAKKVALEVKKQIEENLSKESEIQYMYPPINLLKEGKGKPRGAAEAVQERGEKLLDTLQSFGVEATLQGVTAGPTVTRFEIQLQRGVKVSKVEGLSVEIALALGAKDVRVSTIPDKNAIGIELPNSVSETVMIRDIIGTQIFRDAKSKVSFAVGKDIGGDCVIGDIAKMPHMLIAGTTGSGKSVCINSMIISILYKATPEEVRLIMVDPKMIELKVYNGIPHLLVPVVTDAKKAAGALQWAVIEMMKRYQLFSEMNVRDIKGYNEEIKKRADSFTEDEKKIHKKLPEVVIVIDELSDLMTVAKKEVEESIIRIAQMARAAGMHLIVATQRPSADVITGLIKANVPSRIAFAVSSQIESRIILDQMGAETLVGKGDMLYSPLGGGRPRRIQGCFVSDEEVESVVEFIKSHGTANYDEDVISTIEEKSKAEQSAGDGAAAGADDDDDEMLEPAIELAIESGQIATSMLQRRLKLGYSRAARIVDILERKGIVGPFNGSKPREILITRDQWAEMKLRKKDGNG